MYILPASFRLFNEMFSMRSFATHSAPSASSWLSDKSYSRQRVIRGQVSATWKAIVPSSGVFIALTYQVLNGEIHLQHLHQTLSSPCLDVVVCQFKGANICITLKREICLSVIIYRTHESITVKQQKVPFVPLKQEQELHIQMALHHGGWEPWLLNPSSVWSMILARPQPACRPLGKLCLQTSQCRSFLFLFAPVLLDMDRKKKLGFVQIWKKHAGKTTWTSTAGETPHSATYSMIPAVLTVWVQVSVKLIIPGPRWGRCRAAIVFQAKGAKRQCQHWCLPSAPMFFCLKLFLRGSQPLYCMWLWAPLGTVA